MKHRSIPPFLDSLMVRGELRPGQSIAVRSAGSAAVSVAWSAARIGCGAIAVLPPGAPPNMLRMLRWLGAECHRLPPREATELMAELRSRTDTYVLEQASEPGLIDHYRSVAAEILDEMPDTGAIAVGIGTGLSITGIAREVRDRGSSCRVFGVEPAEAAIASGRPWAPHHIPGLAPPIAQPLLEHALLAGIVAVSSEEAWRQAREAARRSGLPLGPSSGATVAAARELRERGLRGPVVSICACSINDYLEGAPEPIISVPAAGAATAGGHG
jgi:cysteine synthase A